MNPAALAVHACWRLAAAPAARRFARAMKDPEPAQRAILARILRDNARTRFGRAHGFADLRDPEAFQRAVPVRDEASFAPWLTAAAAGQADELTPGRPLAFLPTSGTRTGAKLIPWTAALKREFNAALGPWIHGFMRAEPAAWRGAAYWSLSPPTWPASHTAGGIPIGFESDAAYLPAPLGALLGSAFAAPPAVARLREPETWRYATLLHLLAAADLSLISIWSPTFLTALLEPLADWWPALLKDLERGSFTPPFPIDFSLPAGLCPRGKGRRASQLRGLANGGRPPAAAAIWPRLAAISCWTNAAARGPSKRLAEHFPQARIVPKGLLATEGVVSIPWPEAPAPALAVTAHFYEFVDAAGIARGAWELREQECYAVLLTTGGGLYRYQLHDLVRVVGHHDRCPLLEFVGREGFTCDLCGEKLAEPFVREGLARLARDCGQEWGFALLAPAGAGDMPAYTLFLACPDPVEPARLAEQVETMLGANGHYAHARRIGQLGPATVALLPGDADWAWARFQAALAARGQRPGDIKPTALDAGTGWAEVFNCPPRMP
jgi:hypothetical protein